MDLDTISQNLPIIIAVLVLVFVQFFLSRRRRPQATQRDVVTNLLSEVRLNLAIAEVFDQGNARRFEMTSWQRSRTKLDFLDQSLQVALTDAFTMIEDFNQQIAAAKKHRSPSYMASVDAGKLKRPLTKSKEGLEDWITSSSKSGEPPSKTSGVVDGLFTGRG
jgi:hypothetical protein